VIQKPLNEINIEDLKELVTNSVPEGRNLDYKRDLCSNVQVFRPGTVETVSSVLVSERDGDRYIASVAYEKEIINSVEGYLLSMQKLGVVPPVLFLISLPGVKGSFMWMGRRGHDGHFAPKLFDRDTLVIPDIVIDNLDCDVSRTLRPAFDMIWNACGYARSFNYNEDGDWEPRS